MAKVVTSLAIGSICLLLLYFIAGVNETIEWFRFVLLGSLLSLFFFSPIYALINSKFDYEKDGFILMIGIVYAIFYIFITGSTLEEFTIAFLQSIFTVTIVSLFIIKIKDAVEERL